ncbi:hypothetical protein P5800_26130, partial [Bacillus paranthracis]|nr:hypothetical protein [Bacillus paranthracis]
IFIGIIIVCMSAFFVYQSQGGKTNTERQQTEKKTNRTKERRTKSKCECGKSGCKYNSQGTYFKS